MDTEQKLKLAIEVLETIACETTDTEHYELASHTLEKIQGETDVSE